MVSKTVRTAVFPVAGRGTRFLPVTKASPKEMLPVVDKPLIQYAVEEALAAGAERLIFVTGSSKRAIEDHFDRDHELEAALMEQDKPELLQAIRDIIPDSATCIYVRQSAPLGLGHAVLCARDLVGDEPFYVHLADDLIDAEVPCLAQMQEVFASCEGSIIGVQPVPPDQTDQYGIVEVEDANCPAAINRPIRLKPENCAASIPIRKGNNCPGLHASIDGAEQYDGCMVDDLSLVGHRIAIGPSRSRTERRTFTTPVSAYCQDSRRQPCIEGFIGHSAQAG
ncbi:MAG: UTP--glucose-1-phosphate uridylyltransferase [Proteobacteria bacterium]|nr:UTP--glucose-1-phosphate uridylyltransferase [Pseudomonadota bacterium]